MNEQQNTMGKVIAKALHNVAFRQRLMADPADVLKDENIEVPDGITLKIVGDTESLRHLVLPALGEGKLSDDELAAATAGANYPLRCGVYSNPD